MASLIIDIFLICLGIILVIKYTKKGLVKTVLDFSKLILSIILAFCLRKPLGRAFDSWFMNEKITYWVKESLLATANGEDRVVDFVSIYEDVPSFYTNILTKFGLNFEGVRNNIGNVSNLSGTEIDALADNIGSSISMMLSIILAVVIVFVISIITLSIVVHFLNLLTKFKAINFVNKLLGFVFGILMSFVVLWLVSMFVGIIIKFIGPLNPDVFNNDIIEDSVLLKFFSNLKLLQIFINWIGK